MLPPPNPALVSQAAVRRLPRWALWGFCLAYILPGFLGRAPWKREDITALARMVDWAQGRSDAFDPALWGATVLNDGPWTTWLGGWVLRWTPAWLAPDLAIRLLFAALLGAVLCATWYASYALARSPGAQPLAFAFGGEARPTDYGRTLADGALLALIACLGLAQLGHETSPALLQLAGSAALYLGLAHSVTPSHNRRTQVSGWLALNLGLIILLGAGRSTFALGVSAAVLALAGLQTLRSRSDTLTRASALDQPQDGEPARAALWPALGSVLLAALAVWLLPAAGQPAQPAAPWGHPADGLRLLIWFTWPAWPLALWALLRWRAHWLRWPDWAWHLGLPLVFVLAALAQALGAQAPDRVVLMGLPALATLAAFALPTLSRSLAALIDWFTLLFFSGCALIIWAIWLAMLTGWPTQAAANVARLAPGFVPLTHPGLFGLALAASACWAWLVRWRVGRHRLALWRSLVLPAGGAALCWLLLMTLWLPLLDYARSYTPMVQQLRAQLPPSVTCLQGLGLRPSQWAALRLDASWRVSPASDHATCNWLLADGDALAHQTPFRSGTAWHLVAGLRHPADRDENLYLYRR